MEGASGSQVATSEETLNDPPLIVELTSPITSKKSPKRVPVWKRHKLTLAPSPKQQSTSIPEDSPPVGIAPASPDLPLSSLYPTLASFSSSTSSIPGGSSTPTLFMNFPVYTTLSAQNLTCLIFYPPSAQTILSSATPTTSTLPIIGLDCSNAIHCSAKEGIGITEILNAIITRIPPPKDTSECPMRALIFDR
ncbi:hypothetical protein ZIOFF_044576 [Zingiber officinale]|uniref:Uncharacterized protein n=1 Tax=Zingiber officinale TaxID=94328 RepID=A0A8J5L0D3_ZINOF|nr:hypothetical protein ZIOFF_044576 [Zingiber officinale]